MSQRSFVNRQQFFNEEKQYRSDGPARSVRHSWSRVSGVPIFRDANRNFRQTRSGFSRESGGEKKPDGYCTVLAATAKRLACCIINDVVRANLLDVTSAREGDTGASRFSAPNRRLKMTFRQTRFHGTEDGDTDETAATRGRNKKYLTDKSAVRLFRILHS